MSSGQSGVTRTNERLAQREQAAKRDPRLVAPPTFVNASQKATYVPPVWNVRADALNHLSINSKGYV